MILDNTSEIYDWDIQQLWNGIQEEHDKEPIKDYDKIKYGYVIKLPIWVYTEQKYEEKLYYGSVYCYSYGRYDIEEFKEEEETRKKNMRKILIQRITNEETIDPRIK